MEKADSQQAVLDARFMTAESITAAGLRRDARHLHRWRELPFHCGFMTMNHAATIGPCGPRPRPPPAAGGGAPAAGAGAGPRSGWKRYTLCVIGSTAIVSAPANVGTVATTLYVSGES